LKKVSHTTYIMTSRAQCVSAPRSRVASPARAPERKRPASGYARAVLYALLLLLFPCAGARAANISLAEYRSRIGQATMALDALSSFDEEISQRARAARIASVLREVRSALPPKLAVEWNNAPLEVDNSWLNDALKEYEKLSPSDARREGVLKSITERLHALGERFDEVLKAKGDGARDKDEEKARLAAILRRSEYNKAAEQSALARLWERFKRWLKSLFPERESSAREPVRKIPVASNAAQIIVITLALAVIAYAAWKLLPRFLRHRGKKKKEKREARVVLGERLGPEETASDILAEAERLARAGDIRGAIRKGYIALLCELGDRKLLRLAQHKTNRDYLRALSDHRAIYGEVSLLTNSFENHWYGYAPGTESDWAAFRMHYQQALEQ
jgi:Domain of unknown function (DUF4129)